MPAKWVDFRHVRETVDFGAVLERYGVTLKLRGADQHHGFCPLPGHDGQRRSPSFSANLARRIFHCFGCQAQGNAIDFVALMEGLNPDDPRDVREAALLIQERFLHEEAEPPPPQRHATGRAPPEHRANPPPNGNHQAGQPTDRTEIRPNRRHRHPRGRERPKPEPSPSPSPSNHAIQPRAAKPTESRQQPDNRQRVINAPLDFELKGLDPDHPYLQERGLTPETIRMFGLGYCGRGLMTGRIAIPLHNAEGRLIGYAGRVVDDAAIGEENPKYRLPGKREKDGTVFEFSKGAFLFNGHRVQAPATDLIVVEGFFSVFHLHQSGWTNAVALMGSSCSPEQAELIVKLTKPDGRVWVMPDGDDAGFKCAGSVLAQVAPHRLIGWFTLEPRKDPCDYSRDELARKLRRLA